MSTDDLSARAASRLDAERDARLRAITALGDAADMAAAARNDLATAEKQHTDAYAHAQRLGWTDADFKELGISLPGKRPPGRPRSQRRNPQPTAPSATEHQD